MPVFSHHFSNLIEHKVTLKASNFERHHNGGIGLKLGVGFGKSTQKSAEEGQECHDFESN